MQWSAERHGGFSTAERTVRPVIDDAMYGYQRVNVEAQRRDPGSLLNWIERKIRMRRECPEISWGSWRVIDPGVPGVLVMRYDWGGHVLVILHNFTPRSRVARLTIADAGDGELRDLLGTNDSTADGNGRHAVQLEPYAYRWFRSRGADRSVPRASG